MKGLEISIKYLSELREHILGSNFNSSIKQFALNKIKSMNMVSDYFTIHSDVVKNITDVISYDLTHTLGNFLHEIEVSEKIEGNRKLAKDGDFIISRLRSYLREFAVVKSKKSKQVFSTEYLVYRPKSNEISSNTLLAFCLTDEVQTILDYSQYGTEHPRFYDFVFNELPLPDFLLTLNNDINILFNRAYANREKSQSLYSQAESLLLQEIGLQDFVPSQEAVNIKSFKESFGVSGRLDAEYYQVKYEEIIEKIKSQKQSSLSNLVKITKSIEPGSAYYSDEKGLPFYRVSDYNKFGLSQPDKELTTSFVTENKELITKLKPRKNTILFSKDGSVGTAYLLREDLDGITSGAILHLQVKNTKEILPEYLTLALNSKLVQMQAERDAGGSIILHWRVSEIENVVVPIIPFEKQEEIAKMVEESFRLKEESERLLELAKQAVEIAIEKNEEAAIEFITKNVIE